MTTKQSPHEKHLIILEVIIPIRVQHMDAGSQGTENHFVIAIIFAATYNKTATTRKQRMDSEYAAYSCTTNTYLMMKNVTAQLTTDEAQKR